MEKEFLEFYDFSEPMMFTHVSLMHYVDDNLKTIMLSEEYSWLDTGTFDTLLEASNFVKLNKK